MTYQFESGAERGSASSDVATERAPKMADKRVSWAKRLRRRVFSAPWVRRAAAAAYGRYIGFVFRTSRWRFEGFEPWEARIERGEAFVIAHWHQRLAMMPYTLDWRRRGLTVLASGHRDAEFAVAAARQRGIEMVRLSKDGANTAILRGLVRAVRSGRCVCLTPDGPRGPRRVAKAGVLEIASIARAPIAPISYSLSSARVIHKAWDRFLLPLPFGRGVFRFGDPIHAPRPLDAESRAQTLRTLTAALIALDDRCDAECGRPAEPEVAAPAEAPAEAP